MKIFVVRHAETEYNKAGIIHGYKIHGKLSELGKKQAELLANRLSKEKIEVIYSSDLDRCKQTIKPFLKKSKIPIVYTKTLRDRNYGDYEGKANKDYIEWIKQNNLFGVFDAKAPGGGESFIDVRNRISKFLDELIKKDKEKNILIVTHKSGVTAVMLHLLKKDNISYPDFSPSNAELSIVEIDNKGNSKLLALREKMI